MKPILFVILFLQIPISVFACRNAINFIRPSIEQAFEQSAVVATGTLSGTRENKPGNFEWSYIFKIEKIWKGSAEQNIPFSIEHNSCAKYRSSFPQGESVVGYFTKNKKNEWHLIRLAPSEDDAFNIKQEMEFLEKKTR